MHRHVTVKMCVSRQQDRKCGGEIHFLDVLTFCDETKSMSSSVLLTLSGLLFHALFLQAALIIIE